MTNSLPRKEAGACVLGKERGAVHRGRFYSKHSESFEEDSDGCD